MEPVSLPDAPDAFDPPRASFWKKLGGGSLSISILVHGVLLAIGIVWIFQVIPPAKEPEIDFIPKGGGGGQPGQRPEAAMKRRATMKAANAPRVAAKDVVSNFTLPEPEMASVMSSVGALGSGSLSGGLGGSGTGGGRGTGNGVGFGDGNGAGRGGMGAKPFSGVMFGNPVQARSIGVVLDVSGSMTPHLTKVIKELDRVAEGSPLILYVGCGIGDGRPENKTYSTADIDPKRFERFWRLNHEQVYLPNKTLAQGSAKIKVDFSTTIPAEPLFKLLAARPNTFYLDFEGVPFAWTALVAKELHEVEAVYWFADFQDPVNEKEAETVMRKIRGKKQKLYMHASAAGKYVEKVRDLMVKPTGGNVIEMK